MSTQPEEHVASILVDGQRIETTLTVTDTELRLSLSFNGIDRGWLLLINRAATKEET